MLRSPSGRTFSCSGGSSAVCTVDVAVGSVTMQIPDAEVEMKKYSPPRYLSMQYRKLASMLSL
uniref:Uncharacterized protein n=1 Tax=Macrostomum lignano TaxID=282301 RepID=A0A1I8G542_9PLAT